MAARASVVNEDRDAACAAFHTREATVALGFRQGHRLSSTKVIGSAPLQGCLQVRGWSCKQQAIIPIFKRGAFAVIAQNGPCSQADSTFVWYELRLYGMIRSELLRLVIEELASDPPLDTPRPAKFLVLAPTQALLLATVPNLQACYDMPEYREMEDMYQEEQAAPINQDGGLANMHCFPINGAPAQRKTHPYSDQ